MKLPLELKSLKLQTFIISQLLWVTIPGVGQESGHDLAMSSGSKSFILAAIKMWVGATVLSEGMIEGRICFQTYSCDFSNI